MSDFGSAYPPPPTGFSAPVGRVVRRAMWPRHLISVAFAFVATPVGIALFDYGASEYARTRAYFESDGSGSGSELVLMFAGGLILLTVAATGRLSGLGPILAGFGWALVPLLWYLIDLPSFYDATQELPSNHFWFPAPPYLFGLVALLLIGSGIAGRWRGHVKPGP